MVVLRHIAVPLANEQDVAETARALEPYLDDIHRATGIHVIETRPGAINKAPIEKRRADAEAFLESFESRLGERVLVDTRIAFGTDIAETIIETANEVGATAVAFRSQGRGRLARLLSENTAERLVIDPPLPVLSLAEGPREVSDSTPQRNYPDVEGA